VAQPSRRTRAERLEIARVRRRTVVAVIAFAVILTAAVLWLLGLAGARPAVGSGSLARHPSTVMKAVASGGRSGHG
jgi:hypothetical protein